MYLSYSLSCLSSEMTSIVACSKTTHVNVLYVIIIIILFSSHIPFPDVSEGFEMQFSPKI